MAGYIYIPSGSLLTPTGTSPGPWFASSVDSNFPASNIGDRYPNSPWKSSDNVVSGTTCVGIKVASFVANDFGLSGVFIDAINVTSIKIQAASNSTFSTGLVSTGAITVPFYTASNRYKVLYLTAGGPLDPTVAMGLQYWRVLANISTTVQFSVATGQWTAGVAGHMSVGSVCWIANGGPVQWASGTSQYGEKPIEPTQTNEQFAGGGSQPVILGNPYAVITLGASPASRSDMRSTLLTMLAQEGIGRWFIFYKNDGDTSEAFRCRRAADVEVLQGPHSVINFQGLILEESC